MVIKKQNKIHSKHFLCMSLELGRSSSLSRSVRSVNSPPLRFPRLDADKREERVSCASLFKGQTFTSCLTPEHQKTTEHLYQRVHTCHPRWIQRAIRGPPSVPVCKHTTAGACMSACECVESASILWLYYS